MNGIKGLLASKKGTLSLIIFAGSIIALFCNKLEGMPFAAIVSTIAVIYNYTAHKTDLAAMQVVSPGQTNE